jgi:ketosteroid isomerase-like protein
LATTQTTPRSVFDRYVDAVRASDVDALLSLYADDVHVFDMMEPFERHGTETGRDMIEAWFGHEKGQPSCVIEDLHIEESGDLALARASVCFVVTMADGVKEQMWTRATWGLRRVEDEWKIMLEHTSVPLSGEDMQPMYDGRA